MLRNCRRFILKNNAFPSVVQRNTFLTNDYQCTEAWNNLNSKAIINKINVQDFYNAVDQNHALKGVVSAIDVDIFAHAIKDSSHIEELKDLLHKLRLSAETGNMLESTQHATIRKYLQFGDITELVGILRDPLNFGVFLDDYSANILLNKLITSSDFDLAARVASLIMLQEEYSNEITCTLCQYACYKYILSYTPEPSPPSPPSEKNKKVEEIKIRVKYLRNPYFDDHFDIKDNFTLSGKTLAWMSETASNNLNNNLQIIGWLIYKKYDKLVSLCESLSNTKTFKIYKEVLEQLQKETANADAESKPVLENCYSVLSKVKHKADNTLEESIKIAIENAINKLQKYDIEQQEKLFKSWAQIREEKLEEQTKRLDRARRIQLIEEKQKVMKEQEQKLWFFENEDQIDLQIEEKSNLLTKLSKRKKALNL
ncbi:unnamed protein product [Arctia plantaginis]|uniref:28S ribosomal protein S27, mitochondrial n=1 Tax=Arctia plantaginis TaxID=874455 RepID=A0A8S0ZSI6_ARCPL|nr:unnamed protein product [Arctia plantaginis]